MNIDAAKSYALDYLMRIVDPKYAYHNLSHTMDVFQSVSIIAIDENINETYLTLLQTAALYHDLGIYTHYLKHEAESIRIINEVLPGFDFAAADIKIIARLITDTNIKCKPKTKMGELLCDADLDYLGREDYFEISDRLRKEWEACGFKHSTDKEWYLFQLFFLENHSYYSDTAKRTRDKVKLSNMNKVAKLLTKLEDKK